MLSNYFKTAWRNLVRNKAYGALNIFGLAIGMTVALLIGLWVQYQYSYGCRKNAVQRAAQPGDHLARRAAACKGDRCSEKFADGLSVLGCRAHHGHIHLLSGAVRAGGTSSELLRSSSELLRHETFVGASFLAPPRSFPSIPREPRSYPSPEARVPSYSFVTFASLGYMAEQRTKEIGIRKVLGASVSQIWFLLSRDFIVLVLVSCIIASPIAFYFLHSWLLKYEYRIAIGPLVFVATAFASVVITVITISFQAIRAALANPVKSLHAE